MNRHIFRGVSVYYGLKLIWRSGRTPLKSESGKVSVMDYQWQSSIVRGCFDQVLMQSPSTYRILERIPCYVSSCNVVFALSLQDRILQIEIINLGQKIGAYCEGIRSSEFDSQHDFVALLDLTWGEGEIMFGVELWKDRVLPVTPMPTRRHND